MHYSNEGGNDEGNDVVAVDNDEDDDDSLSHFSLPLLP